MNYWYLPLFVFLLVGCTATTSTSQEFEAVTTESSEETLPLTTPTIQATKTPIPPNPLPYLGQAPELTNEVWLNTDGPLRLADLRGKVVLLEMWTFG